MARLQLRLLGGFDLQAGPGQAVPIRLKKAQALLAYLACHPGQSCPRDKLATLLWPERDDRQARANLRKVLFVLRPRLSLVPPSLRLDEDTVTLDSAALDVDVLAFQRLARRADPEALQQAVDLYGGDLLEGLGVTEAPFEEWLVAERERLRELALETLAKLLADQTKSEESGAAVATALRLLALDPLQEAVHRALMRLYVRDGRRDAALRQYQSCVDTLRPEPSDRVQGHPHGHGSSRCTRTAGAAPVVTSPGRSADVRSRAGAHAPAARAGRSARGPGTVDRGAGRGRDRQEPARQSGHRRGGEARGPRPGEPRVPDRADAGLWALDRCPAQGRRPRS